MHQPKAKEQHVLPYSLFPAPPRPVVPGIGVLTTKRKAAKSLARSAFMRLTVLADPQTVGALGAAYNAAQQLEITNQPEEA